MELTPTGQQQARMWRLRLLTVHDLTRIAVTCMSRRCRFTVTSSPATATNDVIALGS